jgi:hypothetical protein
MNEEEFGFELKPSVPQLERTQYLEHSGTINF